MKLVLFYLTEHRRHFTFPHFIDLLTNSKKIDCFTLLILTNGNDLDFYNEILKNTNINFSINDNFSSDNYNYLNKVKYAIEFSKSKNIHYMMKCDNDLFLKSQTLDYLIDNLELLNNPNNLTIGPTLTSGIPGVEYFIESFFDIDSKNKIEELFLKTNFYDRDGATYSQLNNHTIHSSKWDKNSYFEEVKKMCTPCKGVHPIRFSKDAIVFLNDYIINNKDKFLEDKELSIITNDDSPYLCNSIFCIKTEVYDNIVKDNSLYIDVFEEIPLNKYCWNNNMKHLFIKNGYCIHMYYNWTDNHIGLEIDFVKKFFMNE
jgi:hypothetical protein